jgi:hypothetical protein
MEFFTMALAKTLDFGEQLLLWGDGGSPTETFTPLCGFTSLTLTVNIETNSVNVPDCDDPELPAWLVSREVSKQMQLSGNGVIDTDVLDAFNAWILEGGEKTFRWMTDGKNDEANGYWEASGILSAYSQSGERGNLWTQDTTILLNGAPDRVDLNAAPFATVAPAITGTTEVGDVLTVSDGTWSNSPDSYAYAWYRNGSKISGAATDTYTLQAGDEGATIRARVTATNTSGSRTVTSNSVGPVTAP